MADEDPLAWMIELDAKLGGVLDSVLALEKLEDQLKVVNVALKKTDDASKKTSDQHEKHAHKAHTLGHELEELNKKLKALTAFTVFEWGFDKALELAKELAHVVAEITMEAVNAAAAEERTATSFKLMLGDAQGKEVLEYIDQVAHSTEFSKNELKGFGQELLKAGFSAEQLPHALAATADMAAFSKDRMAGAAGALQTLERIQRTGKVMERSLAPLGIGEDKLIETLKKRGQAGDKESIKKLLQKGGIEREELLQAVYQTITEKTGKDLGAAGVKVGEGLEARLRRLKNLPEEYFEKWAETPGFQTFSDRIDQLFKKLDPESPDGKRIFAALEAVLGEVTGVLEKLLTPEGIESFTGALKGALGVVADLISGLKTIIDLVSGETISKLMFKGDESKQKIAEIDRIQRSLRNDPNAQYGSATGAAAADAYLSEKLPGLSHSEREDLARLGKGRGTDYKAVADRLFPAGVKGISPGVVGANDQLAAELGKSLGLDVSGAYDSGVELATAHEEGVRDKLEIHSPSRVMAELGQLAAQGFAVGLKDGSEVSLPAPSMMLGGGGGAGIAGGVHVDASVHVTMEGGGRDDAEATAQRIRDLQPSALQSLLEQLRAELGA